MVQASGHETRFLLGLCSADLLRNQLDISRELVTPTALHSVPRRAVDGVGKTVRSVELTKVNGNTCEYPAQPLAVVRKQDAVMRRTTIRRPFDCLSTVTEVT